MVFYTLVAGGLGYIGSHVVIKLIQAGRRVVIVDNLANSDMEKLKHIRQVLKDDSSIDLEDTNSKESDKLLFRRADLTVLSEVLILFDEFQIDSVIALAGLKSVNESVKHPTTYYNTNLTIMTNLLEAMVEHHCYNLIFSSSSTVYGDSGHPPFSENDQIGSGITNPYGFTKFLIEQILEDLVKYQKQWKIVSLRYFNPVGCHQTGLLADNPKNPQNLIPIVMRSIVSKKPFNIFGVSYPTKDGTAERDYIHVSDLADAHICALNMKTGYHVYNVGLEAPVSVRQIIDAFERVNNIKLNYQIAPERHGDLASCYAKCDKAKMELGWIPKFDLDRIVKDCYASLRYYKENYPDNVNCS